MNDEIKTSRWLVVLVRWLKDCADTRLRRIPDTKMEVSAGTWLNHLWWTWQLLSAAPFVFCLLGLFWLRPGLKNLPQPECQP